MTQIYYFYILAGKPHLQAAKGAPQRHLLWSNELFANLFNPVGIAPHSWLKLTLNCERDGSEPSDTGITPLNLLLDKSTSSSLFNWPRKVGIGPLRLLEPRSSFCSLLSLLKELGIGPVTFGISANERKLRYGRSPNSAGSVPERPQPRLNVTTVIRPGLGFPHPTKLQSIQQSVLLSQSERRPLGPPKWSLILRRVALSSALQKNSSSSAFDVEK